MLPVDSTVAVSPVSAKIAAMPSDARMSPAERMQIDPALVWALMPIPSRPVTEIPPYELMVIAPAPLVA